MNKYNLILFSCVSDHEYRPWTNNPFIIENVAYSTDASIMAIIPANLTNGFGPLDGYEPEKFLSVVPRLRHHKMSFLVSELIHAISLCPLVPESVDCNACEGDGYVEFGFEFEGNCYSKELECPICKGEGELKKGDTKVLDPEKRIKIGDCFFAFPYMQKIADAAKLLEVEKIDLVLQGSARGGNVFRFDQVEILLMPLLPDTDYEIIYEIKGI